jgi:hypothetical protein
VSETTLVEKLIQLRKKVPYIKKEQKQYIKFSVVSSETVLTEFNTHMNELNIYLKTEVVNKTIERQKIAVNEKTKKDIFSYLVTLDMKYTWINGDNPSEREEVTFSAIADDENSSYAYGQALTYAEKTFFMKEFNIPADDVDPDVFQKEILKRIPASPEQIEAIHIQLGKLEELTEQPKLAFLEQAKMTNGVNAKKAPEEFTGYDFGIVMNTLTGWVNGYEKKKSKK